MICALTRTCFRSCFLLSSKSYSDGVPSQNRCVAISKRSRCCPVLFKRLTALKAFQDNVEALLTEGKLIRVDQDTGTMRIAGSDAVAAGGSAAAGR